MTPETALQKAVRLRLISPGAVNISADKILDRNERPVPDPSVIIGEGQSRDDGDSIGRNRVTVFMDLHIWKKEPSTEGVKQLAGEIRRAVQRARLQLDPGFHCIDARISSSRFLRDPDGETSHAVVTVEAVVQEIS